MSTLENYYDLARADDFERLFGGLKIGRNPTPLHNLYFILKLNFSMVNPEGDHAKTREELRECPEIQASLQEAEQQLAAYRDILERPADLPHRLHTHAVVCIGLERPVW